MLIIGLLVLLVLTASQVQATVTVAPGESIQAAIYAARPGDLVIVEPGTYYEHLKIDKTLTLKGQGRPVLDATASGSAVTLLADGICLEGFRIVNSGNWPRQDPSTAGIRILSDNNTITDNQVVNNFQGILVDGYSDNKISENLIKGNLGWGLRLEDASNNTISGNILAENYAGDAFDSGLNLWLKNRYGDFDSDLDGCRDGDGDGLCDSIYRVPGGRSVDERAMAEISQ